MELIIKEGTKRIRYGEFAGNNTLEEVVIPNSVMKIEGAAFRNCTTLKKVVLPEKLQELPQSIFEGCTSLSEIILPDSLTIIRNYAFADCSSLKDVELPEKIFVVEPRAFQNAACEGKIVYKGSCRRLHGNTLFTKNAHQTHIEIPEGVTVLDDECFKDYTELETVTFPKSLKIIGSSCFKGCSNLKEIRFHEGLKIGWYSFEKCISLRTIEISENCSVGQLAFWKCENLVSVRLPHKAELDWSAFFECNALEKVYAPEDANYYQLYKRLPDSCRILNLNGKEVLGMARNIREWDGEIPEEARTEIEKLKGMSLDEQLARCYVVTNEEEETCSYGEVERAVTHTSHVLLKKYHDFDVLLVKNGSIVGFVNLKKEVIFLGQICSAYSSVDNDGTGSTYSSSVSRVVIMDL